MRKLMTEEERIQQYKDTNKKRKQMQKSQRKKANKKIRRNESLKVKDDLPKRIPNLKNIHENCKHLFSDGDIL